MSLNFLREILPAPLRTPLGMVRRATVDGARRIAWATSLVHPKPIFLFGNQKSGTTAIAALLGRLTAKSTTLDMNEANKRIVWRDVWEGTIPFDQFIRDYRLEFSRALIKEPHLSVHYEQLKAAFPKARFVFIVRDPRDNVRSILNWIQAPGDLPDLSREKIEGLEKTWPLILDGSWMGLSGENYIEMLAERWKVIANEFLTRREEFILVRYEDFLNDKVGFLNDLAGELGLVPKADITDKLDVQFRPAGKRDTQWLTFFGEDNLARINRICADQMKEFGYDPAWTRNELVKANQAPPATP